MDREARNGAEADAARTPSPNDAPGTTPSAPPTRAGGEAPGTRSTGAVPDTRSAGAVPDARSAGATPDARPAGATPDARPAGATRDRGSAEPPRLRDDARRRAGRVATEASRAAREVGPRLGDGARRALQGTKDLAAEQVGDLAHALRVAGDDLRDRRQEPLARYNDAVADGIERTATYLRDRDLDALADDARLLARRRPALLAGGLIAVGLMTASVFGGGRRRDAARHAPRDDAGRRLDADPDRADARPGPGTRSDAAATGTIPRNEEEA